MDANNEEKPRPQPQQPQPPQQEAPATEEELEMLKHHPPSSLAELREIKDLFGF